MARMSEIDRGEYEARRSQAGSREGGKFHLEGSSPSQALKAKQDMINEGQDLTIV